MIFKSIKHITPLAAMVFYSFVCLFNLSYCTHESDQSTAQELIQRKETVVKKLEKYYSANYSAFMSKIKIGSTVILDTTVVSVSSKDDSFIIKAVVDCADSNRVFTELTCSKQIAEKFNKTKTNKMLIVGKIQGIQQAIIESDIDSLSGKFYSLNLGTSYLIQGVCFDICEFTE